MGRTGSIPVALAAALAAVAVAGCGSSTDGGPASAQKGPAPNCLPKTLAHDAALAGGKLDVSPAPGTVTANPRTQISFLGVPAAEVRDVSVRGSRSGAHRGRLEPYSQGDGGSFLPSKPFDAGEQVSVRATAAGRPISYSFRVSTPYPAATSGEFPNLTADPSEYQGFRTLPGVKAPILTVTHPDEDPAAGDVFTTSGPGPGAYGPLIYTPQGRLVWFDRLSGGRVAENLDVQEYEGAPHITFWQGKVVKIGYGLGEDVVLDSRYRTVARVKGGNGLQADLHDFQIAGDHVSYNTAIDPIRCNLTSAGGPSDGVLLDNAMQEIDMKTGLVRWEWHTVDHIALSESETEISSSTTKPWDWLHLNSIDPLPGGDLLISARNSWAAYRIEAGSGRILWRLGGNKSSFKMGPGTQTAWQHDARMLPNGEITIFDDGANPAVHSQSRAIREKLDLAAHEATLTASYTHPSPPLLAASQGNVQTLPNGDAVVGYGGVPEISEYSASGSLLFDAHLPFGTASYRDYRHPWQGRPATPPALLANANNTAEETILHMSWNGATGVASWRILAGECAGALKPQVTIPVGGFETSEILPRKYAYAQVQALSPSGAVLATSRAAKVGSFKSSFPSGG